MADLVVVDTCVLQKANAPIEGGMRARRKFAKRLKLLLMIKQGHFIVLTSPRLLAEYQKQVHTPRNDYIKGFFELLQAPGRAVPNWCSWSGKVRSYATKCRFPREDYHVLRTAVCDRGSTILSEERRMIVTDACIHRYLRVHVINPTD